MRCGVSHPLAGRAPPGGQRTHLPAHWHQQQACAAPCPQSDSRPRGLPAAAAALPQPQPGPPPAPACCSVSTSHTHLPCITHAPRPGPTSKAFFSSALAARHCSPSILPSSPKLASGCSSTYRVRDVRPDEWLLGGQTGEMLTCKRACSAAASCAPRLDQPGLQQGLVVAPCAHSGRRGAQGCTCMYNMVERGAPALTAAFHAPTLQGGARLGGKDCIGRHLGGPLVVLPPLAAAAPLRPLLPPCLAAALGGGPCCCWGGSSLLLGSSCSAASSPPCCWLGLWRGRGSGASWLGYSPACLGSRLGGGGGLGSSQRGGGGRLQGQQARKAASSWAWCGCSGA